MTLGIVLDFELGIAIADTTATLMSSVLLVPALALRFARRNTPLSRPFLLISGATVAWAAAAILYLIVPEAYDDMVYNGLALIQWFLFYNAVRSYVRLAEKPAPAVAAATYELGSL